MGLKIFPGRLASTGQEGSTPAPWNFFLNPLAYFGYFLVLNVLLSYCTESLKIKFWGGCWGVLLPLGGMAWVKGKEPPDVEKPWEKDLFPVPPLGGISALVLAVLLSRLVGLTSLSAWPMPDDGHFAYDSVDLSSKWSWRFFFNGTQNPPFFNWCLALFFKFLRPGLFSLWLFPALLSILAFLLLAAGALKRFPGSFSFLFLSLGSMDFFLLYAGRFCFPAGFSLLWEALTLALLSRFLAAPAGAPRQRWALLLGLFTGLGFFVNQLWALMGAMVLLAVRGRVPWREKGGPKTWALFLLPAFLCALVFAGASVLGKNGLYLLGIMAFKPGTDWKGQLAVSAANLTAFFWGTPWKFFYGPLWGGMLNPLSGAFFFTGLIECFKLRREPLVQWVFAGFLLFYFPVFFVQRFEIFRVLAVWPFVLFVAALGLQSLLISLPSKLRFLAAVAVLAASSTLNLCHLWGPYHRLWGTPSPGWSSLKSEEYWKAGRVLEEVGSQVGAGLLLADLQLFVTDQTLPIAAFAQDPGLRPGLSLQNQKWVAVLMDAHFKPFLEGRLPPCRWVWLGNNHLAGSGLVLAVIPVEDKDRPLLQKWLEADIQMGGVTREIMGQYWMGDPEPVLKKLFGAYPSLRGDRFLETCFWEKVLYYQKTKGSPRDCLEAIQEGLKRGYPFPPLLNDKGVFLMEEGNYGEARKAFESALRSPLNLTPASENLQRLEMLEKGKS